MTMMENPVLRKAMDGDIHAFNLLFSEFQSQLRSYLYRLTANRNDAEDLTHDTFLKAFEKLTLFRGESSLKTWVFTIGTNLACNMLQRRSRWTIDVSTLAKHLVLNDQELSDLITTTARDSPAGRYEIKEHIDTCFTCMGKTLMIEQQVAVILRDVYDFPVKDIQDILDQSEGKVKYLIQGGRKTLTDIFHSRCALVNKSGVCHQCSELNGWLNPEADQHHHHMKIRMIRDAEKYDRNALYTLRAQLVKAIDPLQSAGHELQEVLLRCNRKAMGEED